MPENHPGRRRALQFASLTLIGGGIGLATGALDPRAPWLGIPSWWRDGRAQAAALTSEDTATDGTTSTPALDLEGRTVIPDDSEGHASTEQITQMRIAPTAGLRFQVPLAGLDAPLNMMSTATSSDGGREATPPGYRAVYVLRDFGIGRLGQAGHAGRIIALAHSAMGRTGPGNFLIDANSGKPTLPVGAGMICAGIPYLVESIEQIRKSVLPHRRDVWNNDPDTLTFITCRQIGGARTTHNTVFFARAAVRAA